LCPLTKLSSFSVALALSQPHIAMHIQEEQVAKISKKKEVSSSKTKRTA